jgi:hypothetical protein
MPKAGSTDGNPAVAICGLLYRAGIAGMVTERPILGGARGKPTKKAGCLNHPCCEATYRARLVHEIKHDGNRLIVRRDGSAVAATFVMPRDRPSSTSGREYLGGGAGAVSGFGRRRRGPFGPRSP